MVDGFKFQTIFFEIDVDDAYTLLGITFKAESDIESTTSTLLNQQTLTNFGTYGQVQTDFLTAFGRLWNNGLGAYMKQLWTEYCDLYISVLKKPEHYNFIDIFVCSSVVTQWEPA